MYTYTCTRQGGTSCVGDCASHGPLLMGGPYMGRGSYTCVYLSLSLYIYIYIYTRMYMCV